MAAPHHPPEVSITPPWLVLAGAIALGGDALLVALITAGLALRAYQFGGSRLDWTLLALAAVFLLAWAAVVIWLKAWRSFWLLAAAVVSSQAIVVLAGIAFVVPRVELPPIIQASRGPAGAQPTVVAPDSPSASPAPLPVPSQAPASSAPHPVATIVRPPGNEEYPLPTFPWPPPSASASYVLPAQLLGGLTTVGQVSNAIVAALESRGYVEHSFFRTADNGVALVTRLERINDDGSIDEARRWPPESERFQSSADLVEFLEGLFFAPAGHFRVIVFILQDLPFSQSDKIINETVAREWLRTGVNVLPAKLAEQPFRDGHCIALIYEFASDGHKVRVVNSRLTGKRHLEITGLLAALTSRK